MNILPREPTDDDTLLEAQLQKIYPQGFIVIGMRSTKDNLIRIEKKIHNPYSIVVVHEIVLIIMHFLRLFNDYAMVPQNQIKDPSSFRRKYGYTQRIEPSKPKEDGELGDTFDPGDYFPDDWNDEGPTNAT